MKRKPPRLRLSPNEEARIIREEQERRRKLRIQQVREQQRHIALHIRREVEQRRQQELQLLEEALRQDWEQQQRHKLQALQSSYQESLQLLGQGHRSAKENEPDLAAIARREEEHHVKAEERYREALKELKSQRLRDQQRHNQCIDARKRALQAEKERSARVASLPPPPPDPLQTINTKKPHVVRRSDVSAFASTHYHMPESAVDRELDVVQPDATKEAELEARRLQDLQREEERRRQEQREKAFLRGRQALRREQLVQDRERLLVELEHMQQSDLLRRRQQVAQMPPQIFQPLYKRQETQEDFQRELEFAFEDMYTGERRVKGDLVVQLAPEPLPAESPGSQDRELDVTLDEVSTPETENTQRETEPESGSSEQETSAEVASFRPAPRRVLTRLLDRIRNQKNQLSDSSRRAASDQVPDSSIETGSLLSEKHKLTAGQLCESVSAIHSDHGSPASETSKPSPASDDLAVALQKSEEERRKREEELQQQAELLQELEEQKAELEQLLQEAQRERERLQAAVTRETSTNQSEEPPDHREDVSALSPTELDDHSSRVQQYQLRLLHQTRVHQSSVEEARRRLEEYQRALRLRYNMAAAPPSPPVVKPSGYAPPPQQVSAPSQLLLAPPADELSDAFAARRTACGRRAEFLQEEAEEAESVSDGVRNPRVEVTARLTASIMERVTEHLPARLRPFAVTTELQPPRTQADPHPGRTQVQPRPHPGSIQVQPRPDSPQDLHPRDRLVTNRKDVLPQGPSQKVPPQRGPPQSSPSQSGPPQSGPPQSGPPHSSPPQSNPHQSGPPQRGALSPTEGAMEPQRRAVQEVLRRVLEQREAVSVQQRRLEAERLRREVQREQMRRQKEALEALIGADAPAAPPVSKCGGEEWPRDTEGPSRLQLLNSLLRAIEESHGGTLAHLETETPRLHLDAHATPTVCVGQGAVPPPGPPLPAARAPKPPVTRVRPGLLETMNQQHELSAIQEVETPVNRSRVTDPEESEGDLADVQETPEASALSERRLHSEETPSSSGRSSQLTWRERLLSGAMAWCEASDPGSYSTDSLLRFISPVSSDHRSLSESLLRPPDSDCLSSTTISTGSYVTTDLEHDHSIKLHRRGEAALPDVMSPPGRSSSSPVDNDSSIQRIIDRYTRELHASLSTAGRTTDSDGSTVDGRMSSVSPQSGTQVSDSSGEDSGCLVLEESGRPFLEDPGRFVLEDSGRPLLEDPSLAEHQVQDSFWPLIGQLVDQSSSVVADGIDSAWDRLASSVVDPDQGGWDSALSRMIGRLSGQSGGGRDQNQMRPLVGELDESAPLGGGSGETSHVTLGVSSLPDASPHRSSYPPPLGTSGAESFHPLPVELTHNNTTDASITFHPLQHSQSPEGGASSPPDDSDPSPERLRADGWRARTVPSPPLHQSFSLLLASPDPSPLTPTAAILSPCDDAPPLSAAPPPDRDADSDKSHPAPLGEETCERYSEPKRDEWRPPRDSGEEKGIMEQSEITLVSLSDTTLQDQETSVTEEEEQENEEEEEENEEEENEEEEQENEEEEQENEQEEASQHRDGDSQSHAETLQEVQEVSEVQWGPGGSSSLQEVQQQKLRALVHRSNRRVDGLKAKAAVRKTGPEAETSSRSRAGQTRTRTEEPLLPPAGGDVRVKRVEEVRTCTATQRRHERSAMHQRTRRLYEQLEEVKRQRAVRSRQQDSVQNRRRAEAFHQKTLQKLRAKRTPH